MFTILKKIVINYKNRIKIKNALKTITRAKKYYLNNYSLYMCPCFILSISKDGYVTTADIVQEIPEFNPSTFGVTETNYKLAWWDSEDRTSRIEAFDKLIEIYEEKLRCL